MDEQIQRLRDAGFDDKDIEEYMAKQRQAQTGGAVAAGPVSPEQSAAQPADVPFVVTPTAVNPVAAPENQSMWDKALDVGSTGLLYAAQHPAQVLGLGTAALGLGAANSIKNGMVARAGAQQAMAAAQHAIAQSQLVTAQGIAAREAERVAARQAAAQAAQAAAQPRIIVPESAGGVPRPVVPEVAPGAAPGPAAAAEARAPSILQQGMDMARRVQQIAFEKVAQGARVAGEGLATAGRAAAPYAAPVAVGLTAALMPGNAGGASMMVPQTGRLRGSDLNPMTGRPWTAQELQAYNANPNLIDSRLPR
jgi:hypothetical protein